jgi:hypothetical protein
MSNSTDQVDRQKTALTDVEKPTADGLQVLLTNAVGIKEKQNYAKE